MTRAQKQRAARAVLKPHGITIRFRTRGAKFYGTISGPGGHSTSLRTRGALRPFWPDLYATSGSYGGDTFSTTLRLNGGE